MADEFDLKRTHDKSEESKATPQDNLQKKIIDLKRRAEAAYNKHNYRWASEIYGEIFALNREQNIDSLNKMLLSSLGNISVSANKISFYINAFIENIPLYIKLIKKTTSKADIKEILVIYENILRNNPHSIIAMVNLAKIYEESLLYEQAALILENYLRVRKNNLTLLRKVGNLYIKVENIDKARRIFKKILELKPFDSDAEKKLRDLLAISSIDESRLKGEAFQEHLKDKDFSHIAEIELKADKTPEELKALIQYKEKEIHKNPGNLSLFYDILGYYRELDDKEMVYITLERIAKLAIGDLNILFEKMEAKVNIYQHEISKKKSNGEDTVGIVAELKDFKKKTYLELCEQFPSNIDLKFKFAKFLYEVDELDEALKLFQMCSKVSEISAEAVSFMGKIFSKKKMHDLAIDQFKTSIEKIKDMNEIKKDMIYNLGLTYEEIGKKDLAMEQYKIIYKDDVGYRDINKRIESFYNKQ
ncbi:MAG: hypothetical protein ACD_79C00889G0002 [uncultured bacterium]|nr:MAG: hypothetical protein ACD_79C00889G0002 [uncultured bacterium]